MKIESTRVTKFKLSDLDRLDPVTVITEDIAPGNGKIIIECYGESWSAYWGAMGKRTIAEFFCSCDEHYISGKLSGIPSMVTDYDGIEDWLVKKVQEQILSVLKDRRDMWRSKDMARLEYDDLKNNLIEIRCASFENDEHLWFHNKLLHTIIGDEWRHELPEITNPDYQYLCRIIKAVQEGLRQYQDQDKTATANAELASI